MRLSGGAGVDELGERELVVVAQRPEGYGFSTAFRRRSGRTQPSGSYERRWVCIAAAVTADATVAPNAIRSGVNVVAAVPSK